MAVLEQTIDNNLVSCLSPLLTSLGWEGEKEQLLESIPETEGPLTLSAFMNAMANLKYANTRKEMSTIDVTDEVMPCLYVPKAGAAKVLINRAGEKFYAFDSELQSYTHLNQIDLKPEIYTFNELEDHQMNYLQPIRQWFGQVMQRFSGVFVAVLLITFVLTLLAFIAPVFILTVYNKVLNTGAVNTMFFLGIGVIIYIFADLGFNYFRIRIFAYIRARFGNILENEVFRRLLYLPSSNTEGVPINLQINKLKGFEFVGSFFGSPVAPMIIEIPFLGLLIFGMYLLGGSVAFIPLGAIVVYLIFLAVVSRLIKGVNTRAGILNAQRKDLLLEILSNMRAIKYTASKKHWAEKYHNLSAEAGLATYQSIKATELVNAFSAVIVSCAGIGTIASGVLGVMSGTMSAGGLMACMLLVWRILGPLKNGFGLMNQMKTINRGVGQIDKYMEIGIEQKLNSGSALSEPVGGKLSFSQVSLRYRSNGHPALRNINFMLYEKECLFVMGHEGAGKSSLLKLILGLYKPNGGRILIDDISSNQIDPISLRRSINYSQEESQYFAGSIAQNLRLANLAATDEEIMEAAERAGVLKDINRLPEQFATIIDDKSHTLLPPSFFKRLSLARMFLRNANLLLVDEPEKGLDEGQDGRIIKELNNEKSRSTIIIVSQKARYLDLADKILWLDRGAVKMYGTKDQVKEHALKYLSMN